MAEKICQDGHESTGRRVEDNGSTEGVNVLGGVIIPGESAKAETAKPGRVPGESVKSSDQKKGKMIPIVENKSTSEKHVIKSYLKGINEMGKDQLEYTEENTVIVSSDGTNFIDCDEMMDCIEEICGDGSVIGCVPRGKKFEVTLREKSQCDLLVPTFDIGDKEMKVNPVKQSFLVVSILNLPVYTTDREILDKLEGFGLEIISPVYRKMRVRPNGKKTPDGTRFAHAIFPEALKSLPYAMKFNVRGQIEHFKVKHDDQIKVCNKCYSDKHLARRCPENRCFRCHNYGHIAIDCDYNSDTCDECGMNEYHCNCLSDPPRKQYNPKAKDSEWDEVSKNTKMTEWEFYLHPSQKNNAAKNDSSQPNQNNLERRDIQEDGNEDMDAESESIKRKRGQETETEEEGYERQAKNESKNKTSKVEKDTTEDEVIPSGQEFRYPVKSKKVDEAKEEKQNIKDKTINAEPNIESLGKSRRGKGKQHRK